MAFPYQLRFVLFWHDLNIFRIRGAYKRVVENPEHHLQILRSSEPICPYVVPTTRNRAAVVTNLFERRLIPRAIFMIIYLFGRVPDAYDFLDGTGRYINYTDINNNN